MRIPGLRIDADKIDLQLRVLIGRFHRADFILAFDHSIDGIYSLTGISIQAEENV